jgi:hypothetical protein
MNHLERASMDEMKLEMTLRCGRGGMKCTCCNDFTGKEKPLLVRQARRVLKERLRQDVSSLDRKDLNATD